jgi:hypothetical protein
MKKAWKPTALEKIEGGFFYQIVFVHRLKRWRWHVGAQEFRMRPALQWARAAGYCATMGRAMRMAEAAARALRKQPKTRSYDELPETSR